MLYLLFFLSGISGLLYQVVWVRVFGNVFGNTVYSASVVVAVFMLGLGVGSYAAGVWADRRYSDDPDAPLRAYGYFECVIAALGLLIALVLPHLDRLSVLVTSYSQDANGWYVITAGSYAARVAIAVALLVPITVLMGATLTLLIRYLVRMDVEVQGRRIAVLYAVNTAGAAAGCFLTDFALVPAWGLRNTQLLAVTLNLLAGAGAIALVRLSPSAQGTEASTSNARRRLASAAGDDGGRAGHSKSGRGKARKEKAGGLKTIPAIEQDGRRVVTLTSVALAMSGLAALGMEILWFRHFSIMLGAFRAVFSLLLTVILVGIGAGALIAAVVERRTRRPAHWLIATQALFIVSTLIGMAAVDSHNIDRTVSSDPAFRAATGAAGDAALLFQAGIGSAARELWFNLRAILPEVALPALLMGFSFPLANAVIQHAERSVGRRAGVLYLANTAGAVAGSLIAGFLLLPRLGLQGSATILMLAAAAGLVPLWLASADPASAPHQSGAEIVGAKRAMRAGGAIATASIVLAGIAIVSWLQLPSDFVRARALPQPDPDERVLSQSEGVNEIVTITETTGKGRRLMTNGHAMSATWPLSQRYMRAIAHVPLLMIEAPKRALVIGFGVGNTTAAATLHPTIQRIDVADLSRNVLDHASWFSGVNGNVLKDPHVAVYVNDGRHHLQLQEPESYDLIALEPPPIGYAGVSALYSEEFYELARTRLNRGGFISQWLPAYQVPIATTLSMIRSFVDVFPQSVLLSGAQADLILVGAKERIEVDPIGLFTALSQRPAVRADLARLNLGTPREIVGMFVGSASTLQAATRDVVPVTDDRPVQEYGVRSLLNFGEFVPGSVVDLSGVSAWCPKCFENGVPVRVVEGLDVYLALLNRAYASTPAEGARTHALAEEGRIVAGSAYLGAVVPETADVHNSLGIALASRGQLDQAISEFRQALALDPSSAQTHWHLGAALADRGQLQEAADYLRRSVQLDPNNDDARHDLDAVLALQRKP